MISTGLWDSWLRRDSLEAIGRAFGKLSSVFIASWPQCCVDRLSRQGYLRRSANDYSITLVGGHKQGLRRVVIWRLGGL